MKTSKTKAQTAKAATAAIGSAGFAPGGGNAGGPGSFGTGGIDVLIGVSLVSFTATPAQIVPFGASQLQWEVEGPPRGFVVKLNNEIVARKSQKFVQPQNTSTYRLDAVSDDRIQFLGSVTIGIDTSLCEINSLMGQSTSLHDFLTSQIEAEGLYHRNSPSVDFSPGTIRFRLRLGKDVSFVSDPDIKIDASFGLTVTGGKVVGVAKSIDVEVSFPWYAGFNPLTDSITLQIERIKAEGKARQGAEDLIEGFGQMIDLFSHFANGGLIKHSVRIGVDEDGEGTIDVRACPHNLLVSFAKMSSART